MVCGADQKQQAQVNKNNLRFNLNTPMESHQNFSRVKKKKFIDISLRSKDMAIYVKHWRRLCSPGCRPCRTLAMLAEPHFFLSIQLCLEFREKSVSLAVFVQKL